MNLQNWFMGVVEDDFDPEGMGRVKVRCFGHHTADHELLPTRDLPYMQTIHPVTAGPAVGGNGTSPTPLLNSIVFGAFYDGNDTQDALILGTLPGGDLSTGQYDPNTNFGFGTPNVSPGQAIPLAGQPSLSNAGGFSSSNGNSDRVQFRANEGQYPGQLGTGGSSGIGNDFAEAASDVRDLPGNQIGNGSYNLSYLTRDQLANRSSPLGSRKASLDYNAGGGSRAEIIIPDPPRPGSNNYEANLAIWNREKAAATDYVNRVTALMRSNGFEYTEPNVFTTSQNRARAGTQGGVGGYFHTEPAFVDDRINGQGPIKLLQEKPELHAKILSETLGTIPGVTFIAPHVSNDFGAGARGVLQETPFAQNYTLPALELLTLENTIGQISQLIIDQGVYENELEQPIDPETGEIIQTAVEFHRWATTRGAAGITVNSGSNHNVQAGTIFINKSMFGGSPQSQKGLVVSDPTVFDRLSSFDWGEWISFNLSSTGVSPVNGLTNEEVANANAGKAEEASSPSEIQDLKYYGPAEMPYSPLYGTPLPPD